MPRAGLTADRLVESAAQLADREGLDAVTLAALAKQHGVAAPSLYVHVRGSPDLRTRVALLALRETAERAEEAIEGKAGRAALAALGGVYLGYAREHPGRYAAMRLPLDDETAAASAGPRHAAVTRAVLAGYRLGKADQTHAVRLIGATFHGYATLDAAGAFSHSPPRSDVTWRRVVDGLHDLLCSWEKQ